MNAAPSSRDLTERESHILDAVVRAYVETGEPVPSRAITDEPGLDVSAATVRHGMAELEALGYLSQPHTSAGRVPTEKAFRYYVDRLAGAPSPRPGYGLSESERRRLAAQFDRMTLDQWEDLFLSACQFLALLSRHVAVAVNGELQEGVLERLELVPLGGNQTLAVLVTRPALVRHRVFSLEQRLTPEQHVALVALLNERLAGRTLREIQETVNATATLYRMFDGRYRDAAAEAVRGAFLSQRAGTVYWDGVRNLRAPSDRAEALHAEALYEALELRTPLLDMFDAVVGRATPRHGVHVLIGSEIPHSGMEQFSLISATYRLYGDTCGFVGVIGPLRMEYGRLIPLVGFTAEMMTHYFDALNG
jgi:heat-inducible transcriptional repressor